MRSRRVTVGVSVLVALIGVWWVTRPEPPEPVRAARQRSLAVRPSKVAPRPSEGAPGIVTRPASDASVPRATKPAEWPGVSDWMAMVPLVLAYEGLESLGPWQSELAAAHALCSGGEAASFANLDAWAEAALWNRESRRVWWISRRLSGRERMDAVTSFIERKGIEDCPTLRMLESAWEEGREAPYLPPLYGDPEVIGLRDQHALQRLRAGLTTSDEP